MRARSRKLRIDASLARHVRRARVELGVAHSRLVVAFGQWEGSVGAEDGSTIRVDEAWGWAEDHDARW